MAKKRESTAYMTLDPALPRDGWQEDDVIDLQTPDGICDACGYPSVRYIHALSHLQVMDFLEVGCVCAEYLTGDPIGPRQREQRLKTFSSRLIRFMQREWYLSEKGTHWMKYKGHLLWVYRRADRSWGCAIDRKFFQERFDSNTTAKEAIYKHLFGPAT